MKSLCCWEQIVDPVNVWGAWRDFARGKRRRPDVARFDLNAAVEVVRLAEALRTDRWRPSGYRLLRIADPKRRIVSAAPVRDRVVHHALHRVAAPWWDRSFSEQSFACIEGRGSHRALLRFREGLRRHRFVMQLDMRGYFYNIDRSLLFDLLCRRLPEAPMRILIARILDSGAGLYADPALHQWLGWERPPEPGRGLPIGNLTSQWWGNVYLDGLDHFAQRTLRVGAYQRYMDDVAVFGSSREELVEHRQSVAAWLWRERRLVLKDPAACPLPTRGDHTYLGYRVSHAGFAPGDKMRQRVATHVEGKGPAELRESVAAMAAAWLWPVG